MRNQIISLFKLLSVNFVISIMLFACQGFEESLLTNQEKSPCTSKLKQAGSFPIGEFTGDGSKENPFWICSVDQFLLISKDENRSLLKNSFILQSDLDMTAIIDYQPIGKLVNQSEIIGYSGIFNGNGFTIKNLKISKDRTITTNLYIGLFGVIYGGEVKNLILENLNVSGYAAIGSLVGISALAQISNCKAILSTIEANRTVGGLIGQSVNSSLTNLVFNGNISAVANNAGGLVAAMTKTIISSSQTNVKIMSSGDDVGGLVARMDGGSLIQFSHAQAEIVMQGASSQQAGGLVASSNEANVNFSSAVSVITGKDRIGGLIGSLNQGFIANSYVETTIQGQNDLGGAVGEFTASTIDQVIAKVNIVSTGANVGGLLGKIQTQYEISDTGVVGTLDSSTTVGGLIGLISAAADNGSINDSFSAITIANCSSNCGKFIGLFSATGINLDMNFVLGTAGPVNAEGGNTVTTTAGILDEKSVTELKTQSTYYIDSSNFWDFTNVWQLRSGEYPSLIYGGPIR